MLLIFHGGLTYGRASLVVQLVKNPPAMQETWVQSLGWEGPLEKETAAHSSILAWRIPWTEESHRTETFTFTNTGKVSTLGYESESEVARLCLTLCNPMDCSLPGSSVHGIFWARILEWAAISFSRASSQLRDRTWVSCIADRRFTFRATGEAYFRL